MKGKITIVLALSVLFVLVSCKGETGPAGASGKSGDTLATAVFQFGVYPSQTFAGTKDARITSNPATTNYGTEDILIAGSTIVSDNNVSNRSFIHFDIVSRIPAGAISVKKAYLTLNVGLAAGTTTVTAYAVSGADRNWIENEITWQRYNAASSWEAYGGDFLSCRNRLKGDYNSADRQFCDV